jgi:hypothetical protein
MSELISIGERSARQATDVLDGAKVGLVGATLRWKRYRRWTTSLPLGRCDLCRAQFTEGLSPGLNSGYSVVGGGPTGQDDYRWICAICYDLERDEFGWTVLDTRGQTTQPPNIIECALQLMEFPVDGTLDRIDESRESSAPPPHRW